MASENNSGMGNPDEPNAATDGGAAIGGLMGLMRRNKDKLKKMTDDEETELALAAQEDRNRDLADKAAIEASLDDEFARPDKKAKGANRKPQQHPQQRNQKSADAEDVDEDEPTDGRVLTKAEKEKLKKEREKSRKKEQAAKKKSVVPVHTPTPSKPEVLPSPAFRAANFDGAAQSAAEEVSADAGKKKKLPTHLALIQKQQEELKRKQEIKARIEAEEQARIEEEERMISEEQQRKDELRAVKKQKEKEKIEQLKKEGKFLTKAQREEKARNELKLQQMREAGVIREGSAAEEKKRSTADKSKWIKKSDSKIDEENALLEAAERATVQAEKVAQEAEEAAARERAEAEAKRAAEGDDGSSDDEGWEALAEEDVKESWDADSDDEASAKPSLSSPGNDSLVDATAAPPSTTTKEKGRIEGTAGPKRSIVDELAASSTRTLAEKEKAAARREKAHQAALAARSKDDLRSPVCCILGHVDTGKTKLLDKIRQTNVQEGEAGGITQQIGATYFPIDAIKQKTLVVNKDGKFDFKVPGLLIIDTPGHESFANLRSRGSSLCNIAILVVDIMHGLEPQTLESMKLLRDRKTPFIVALNKIDRLYGWKHVDNNGFRDSLALQSKGVQNEFKNRLDKTKVEFAEQGFNSELFYENRSLAKNVSMVPTSAHTGEGIPDMLKLIVQLTQDRMVGSLMYLSEVQATVLEVKAIEGFGTTIDVILSNGILREGDRIVLCGMSGIIKTNIRALLTPAPLRELRIKSAYVHNKEVKAALGVKISAPGLDDAIAGSRLMVLGSDDEEADLEDELLKDLASIFSRVKADRGVSVQASTLGSLEALLDFLRASDIPVANVGIGPVYKRDVIQCSTMLEKAPDYAVMLCFDVKVDKEAQAYADECHVKVFTADIIYHLFDAFTKHMNDVLEKKKENSKLLAVFPCILNPVAVFNKTGPIVVGVDVLDGQLKLDTPIAVIKKNPSTSVKEIIGIGRVTSIEREHKQIQVCKKGQPSVAVKIEMGSHQPSYGRQLDEKDVLYSLLSRASIDCLKEFYLKDLSNDDKLLIMKLKPLFNIT